MNEATDVELIPLLRQYADLADAGGKLHWATAMRRAVGELTQLRAIAQMLDAVVQGAQEEFVRVPYGASHEDVAAINEWHKMAAEARAELNAWESA